MQKAVRRFLSVVLCLGALALSVHAAEPWHGSTTTFFVMTNDNSRNEVLAFQRTAEGRFTPKGRFATGGRGSGGTTDPLQSQGALTLSQDHRLLLAVNAASGTISSFHLLGGIPILVDEESSGGAFPVAVAEHNNTVYALNAGGNGAIVAFRADHVGHLHRIRNSLVYLPTPSSGASSISVSPDGHFLVVIEKVPNNIDVYPINADGTLGAVVTTNSVTPGVFATVFNPSGKLIVSENQPGGGNKSSMSSYTINPDGTLTVITQSIPSLGDGNCWNVVTPDGKFVYADNSGSSNIAGFSVTPGGVLEPIAGTIVRSYSPDATNLDMTISGDGKYLYTLNSGTGSIGVNGINSDGTLNALGDIEGLPKSVGFQGIAAL